MPILPLPPPHTSINIRLLSFQTLNPPLQIIVQRKEPRSRLPRLIRKIKGHQEARKILPIHKGRVARRDLAGLELKEVLPY